LGPENKKPGFCETDTVSHGGGGVYQPALQEMVRRAQNHIHAGRPHHSGGNCFVEQKNGDVLRKTAGYACFEGDKALEALEKVCSFLNPIFYPNKKLIAKETLPNGKVRKVYEKTPKTPCERVPEHPDIPRELKRKGCAYESVPQYYPASG